MKKVSVFIVVLLFMLSFTACSGKEEVGNEENGNNNSGTTESSTVTNLTFWTPLSGGDGDFMKELVSQFNAAHDDIEVEILNLKAEEYYTKLRTSVTAGQAPDVAVGHTSKLADLNSTNLLESINDAASVAGVQWDTFSENIINSTIIDGQHLAIPLDTHALIMYVNKKIVSEAGLLGSDGKPVIEPGPEGFKAFLQQVKQNGPSGTFPLSATSNGDSPLRVWWTLYSQQGGQLLSEDGSKAEFNNEKSLKALTYIEELINEELWPRNIKNGGEIFTANTAAIHLNGVWMTGALEKNENLDFVALPIPKIFETEATWGDSHVFIVPKQKQANDEKKIASVTFANWIADNAAAWGQAGHVPSKPAIVESSEFKELPYRSDYAEIGDYVSYMPNTPKLAAINDVLKKHLNLFMNGQATPEDTLKNAEKEVNDLLAK